MPPCRPCTWRRRPHAKLYRMEASSHIPRKAVFPRGALSVPTPCSLLICSLQWLPLLPSYRADHSGRRTSMGKHARTLPEPTRLSPPNPAPIPANVTRGLSTLSPMSCSPAERQASLPEPGKHTMGRCGKTEPWKEGKGEGRVPG